MNPAEVFVAAFFVGDETELCSYLLQETRPRSNFGYDHHNGQKIEKLPTVLHQLQLMLHQRSMIRFLHTSIPNTHGCTCRNVLKVACANLRPCNTQWNDN